MVLLLTIGYLALAALFALAACDAYEPETPLFFVACFICFPLVLAYFAFRALIAVATL